MRPLRYIYALAFLFSLNVALTAYINSSFLERHSGPGWIGVVFALSAFVSLVLLEVTPRVVERMGNETAFLFALLLSLAGVTLILGGHVLGTIIGFILYNAANTTVFFSLDIFVRYFTRTAKTGTLRGLYLTLVNFAWVFSPLAAGLIVEKYDFWPLYLMAFIIVASVALTSLPALAHFRDATYDTTRILKSLKKAFRRDDIRHIMYASFLLQFFYALMVVFAPLYLIQKIGFDFSSLGLIFTIMLVPFILLQFPLGILADKRFGEKEMLMGGFFIMAVATSIFALYRGGNFLGFALILFVTRIGASIVEVMSETYFFKKVHANEPELISTFRTMAPLAYLIGTALAGIIVSLFGFSVLFLLLSLLLLTGIRFAYLIHDTK